MERGPARLPLLFHQTLNALDLSVQVVQVVQDHSLERLRHPGRAEFERAVMAYDHVFHQDGEFFGKVRNGLDLFPDQLDLHDQVTQELSPIGVFHRPLKRKLIDLANVVEESACEQEIDVDSTVILHHLQDQLEERQGVLEETAQVGMVDCFSRRRALEQVHKGRV